MNTIAIALILSCLFLLGSSRPRVALRGIAVQGFCLGLLPLLRAEGHLTSAIWFLAFSSMLIKGILLPALMNKVVQGTGIEQEKNPPVAFGASIMIGVLLLGLSAWLSARLGLPTTASLPVSATAMFLVLVGLFLMIGRRLAIMQSLAFLVLENGVFTLGVGISLEFPLVVELGILLDVFVGIFLMSTLVFHLDREFQHTDVDRFVELAEHEREGRR
jgi:hydrogenase-4 component E